MTLRAVAVALAAWSIVLAGALPVSADTPIDSTFGAGFRTLDPRGTQDDFVAILVRPGGQVLIGGQSRRANDSNSAHTDPAFVQRTATGGSDGNFGVSGQVVFPLPTFSTFEDFALDPNNGKIVGFARSLTVSNTLYVFRLAANGATDQGFGTHGIKTITVGPHTQFLHLAVEPSHRIVLGGFTTGTPTEATARLLDAGGNFINESGISFGTGDARGNRVAVSPDGTRIGLLVRVDNDGTGHSAIGAWLLDAEFLDPFPSFGDGSSRVMYKVAGGIDGHDILIDGSNRVTVLGNTGTDPKEAGIARFGTAGKPDKNFSGDGSALIRVPKLAFASSLSLDNQGRYTISGGGGGPNGIAMTRLLANGTSDDSFGSHAVVVLAPPPNFQMKGASASTNGAVVVGGEMALHGDTSRDLAVIAFTTAGRVDSAFHAAGVAQYAFADVTGDVTEAFAVAVDGSKRYLGGFTNTGNPSSFWLVRVLSNGYRDPTWGESGYGFDLEVPAGVGRAVAVDSTHRAVMAGCQNCDTSPTFAIARWTPGGQPDSGFGANGVAAVSFGATVDATAFGVAIDPSDRIVAAGNAGTKMAVARLLTNGDLDPDFSGNGKATITLPGGSLSAAAVAVLPSGKILLGGTFVGTSSSFALVRLTDGGIVDTGFGTNGHVITPFAAGDAEATAMAVRADGRIILAGVIHTDGGDRVGIARYLDSGDPDPDFNGTGRLNSGLGLGTNVETSGVVADGDRVVVSGTLPDASQPWFVARFADTGTLDTSYNATGVATTGPSGLGTAHGMALANGRYLIVGGSGNGNGATMLTAAQFIP